MQDAGTLQITRIITLANDETLIVQCSNEFYTKVRKFFSLSDDVVPTDDHIKEFFITFMQAAAN